MPFLNYIKETRAELHHVAWPTTNQTIVYTAFVAVLSIFVALYLGFFDFLFTSTLARLAGVSQAAPAAQQAPIQVTQQPVFSTTTLK